MPTFDAPRFIQNTLETYAKSQGIDILYSCEAGSRAWGLSSPDSDFDVRFVYKRPIQEYHRIDEPDNLLSFCIDPSAPGNNSGTEFEFVGWDIHKALNFLRKSNPTMLEWLYSDIIYSMDDSFDAVMRLRDIATPSVHAHYMSMARHNYHQYIENPLKKGETVRTKKYLYAANPLCRALYCRKYHAFPPMDFDSVLRSLTLTDTVRNALLQLVEEKRRGNEFSTPDESLYIWMARTINATYDTPSPVAADLPPQQDSRMQQDCNHALWDIVGPPSN
jgi:uncharacterized protein